MLVRTLAVHQMRKLYIVSFFQLVRFTFMHVCFYPGPKTTPLAENHVSMTPEFRSEKEVQRSKERNTRAQCIQNNYVGCSCCWSLYSTTFVYITLGKRYSLQVKWGLWLENNVLIHWRCWMRISRQFRRRRRLILLNCDLLIRCRFLLEEVKRNVMLVGQPSMHSPANYGSLFSSNMRCTPDSWGGSRLGRVHTTNGARRSSLVAALRPPLFSGVSVQSLWCAPECHYFVHTGPQEPHSCPEFNWTNPKTPLKTLMILWPFL